MKDQTQIVVKAYKGKKEKTMKFLYNTSDHFEAVSSFNQIALPNLKKIWPTVLVKDVGKVNHGLWKRLFIKFFK